MDQLLCISAGDGIILDTTLWEIYNFVNILFTVENQNNKLSNSVRGNVWKLLGLCFSRYFSFDCQADICVLHQSTPATSTTSFIFAISGCQVAHGKVADTPLHHSRQCQLSDDYSTRRVVGVRNELSGKMVEIGTLATFIRHLDRKVWEGCD